MNYALESSVNPRTTSPLTISAPPSMKANPYNITLLEKQLFLELVKKLCAVYQISTLNHLSQKVDLVKSTLCRRINIMLQEPWLQPDDAALLKKFTRRESYKA